MPLSERRGSPVVAVIPARGGSKRIPRKNIRPFLGTPLLARTIGILRSANLFDRIVVSTDDEEVAAVALGAGAEVPFRRPAALAGDHVPTRPVIEHAIEMLEGGMGHLVGPVCCVYPAAIMVSARMLREGLEILTTQAADRVMTAVPFPAPVQRAWRRSATGEAEMVWPEFAVSRSQDLETLYHDAGQFYWALRGTWMSENRPASVRMLELDRNSTIDIVAPEDWEAAEIAYQLLASRAKVL